MATNQLTTNRKLVKQALKDLKLRNNPQVMSMPQRQPLLRLEIKQAKMVKSQTKLEEPRPRQILLWLQRLTKKLTLKSGKKLVAPCAHNLTSSVSISTRANSAQSSPCSTTASSRWQRVALRSTRTWKMNSPTPSKKCSTSWTSQRNASNTHPTKFSKTSWLARKSSIWVSRIWVNLLRHSLARWVTRSSSTTSIILIAKLSKDWRCCRLEELCPRIQVRNGSPISYRGRRKVLANSDPLRNFLYLQKMGDKQSFTIKCR